MIERTVVRLDVLSHRLRGHEVSHHSCCEGRHRWRLCSCGAEWW